MSINSIYLYQLHGANYSSLNNSNFKVAVIDYEDSRLTPAEVSELSSSGKTLFSYLSIGEAEDFRGYWASGNWSNSPPPFLLGENPNFEGAFHVKFWDKNWQQLVTQRLGEVIKQGYEGVYFDVVDVFNTPKVIAAYSAEFPSGDIKKVMEDFVVSLSTFAKQLNPNFKIIPNNAGELLNIGTLNSATAPLTPNTRFLNAIDGVGKESTFSAGDTYPVAWTAFDKHYLENALNAGKFVLSIEYPTTPALQQTVVDQMLQAGYIPFIANRALGNTVPEINSTLTIDPILLSKATGDSSTTLTITGTNNADVRLGNGGNDSLILSAGNDVAFGQGGNDWMSLGTGDDGGYGGRGNDTIFALEGNDTAHGGSGNDIVYGWHGNDSLEGGDGDDFITGDFGNDTLIGGTGNDGLYGWTGKDSMIGGDGHDFIMSEQEEDTVFGGAGNDTIYAGSEADSVDGGTGDDYILGDAGADIIQTISGRNTIFGGSESDTIRGGSGSDFIGGDEGNDQILGGDGNDVLYGWLGNDSIEGGNGSDLISGEDGDDILFGNAGNDVLYGGAGNDTLQSGTDDGKANQSRLSISFGDVLFGGEGADIFSYSKNGGVDQILDFTSGVDKIHIIGFGNGASYKTLVEPNLYYISWSGAWLFLGEDQAIQLAGIPRDGLSANDFVFF